jgi:CheY-like chemotaxis protein
MFGQTILIVEDDEHLRLALREVLASRGYSIIEGGTGAEGVALAARRSPDLILLDLGLPDEDGLIIARRLRENPETASIPVAVLTGEEIWGARAEEVHKHCIGYIPKPVSPFRLAQIVALFLRVGQRRAKPEGAATLGDDHPKRRYPRLSVEIGALCRLPGAGRPGGGVAVSGLVRTVSEGGVMLELPQSCARGSLLQISMRGDDFRVHAIGEVVWIRKAEGVKAAGQVYHHGLRFVRMADEERDAFRRFIVRRFAA